VEFLAVIAARVSSDSQHSRQRLTRTLFGWLPFLAREQVVETTPSRTPLHMASVPLSTRCDRVQISEASSLELCDRPAMQAALAAFALRRSLGQWLADIGIALPATLDPIPDRVSKTPGMHAAGFADRASRSIQVDIAALSAPAGASLDAQAWTRMFTWLVAGDHDLLDAVACAAPVCTDHEFTGTYTFVTDGITNHGMLTIATLPCGTWRVIDCWGDADERACIDRLVSTLSSR
jgi:hypothetical protein